MTTLIPHADLQLIWICVNFEMLWKISNKSLSDLYDFEFIIEVWKEGRISGQLNGYKVSTHTTMSIFLGMLLSGEEFSGLYPFRFKCLSRRSLRPLNCQYVVWVLSILMQQGSLLTIISFGIRNWERFSSFFNCINVIKILNLPDTWKNYHGSRKDNRGILPVELSI